MRKIFCCAATMLAIIGAAISCTKDAFQIDDPYISENGCIHMQMGTSYFLNCTAAPETAKWTSSNTEVATVENGVIHAHSAGSARITVNPKTGKNIVFDVYVTVIPVTDFTIAEAISVYARSSTYLEVKDMRPEGASPACIAWESSDQSIFTVKVEEGSVMITGIAEGTAKLTGRADDVTRSCTVSVKGPEKLTLPSKVDAYVNHDVEVSVVQEPEVYTDYIWSIRQEGNICNVRPEGAKAVLTGVAIGKCTLELTLAGGSIKKSCEVTVNKGSLVLDKSESSILAGDELTLTATQYPVQYNDYEWVTEDASVATVSGSGNTAVVKAGNMTGDTVIKCYINGRDICASCRISTFGQDYMDKLGLVLMRPTKGPNFVGDKVYISPTRTSDAELRILTIYKTDLPECFKGRIKWSTGTPSADSFSTVIKNQTSYRELTVTCSTPLGDMRLNYIQGFKALEVREFVYKSFPKVATYGDRPGWYLDGNYSHWFDAVYRTLPSKTAELTPEGWANWNIKPNSSFFVTGVDDYGESIGIIQNGYRTSANADGIHTRTDYIHVYYRNQQITDYKNGTWFETDDVTTSKTVDGTVSINNQPFRIHCVVRP